MLFEYNPLQSADEFDEAKRMIDHVLVSSHWEVRKAWIEHHMRGKMVPSDHWPVAAVIALAK